MSQTENKDCFVIMPIGATEGYEDGHFQAVYEDIIKPAIDQAGYHPLRADEVNRTNLIHLDILQKLIAAPVAICDLSTRNPNVLFELGIRQAFDKPVILIQEKGTPKIFDIAPLRYLEYGKALKYRDVLKTQNALKVRIEETMIAKDDTSNVNSIVKLLALSPAYLPKIDKTNKENMALDLIQGQLTELTHMVGQNLRNPRPLSTRPMCASEYERLANRLDKLRNMRLTPEREHIYHQLMRDTEEMMMICEDREGRRMFERLMRQIHEQIEMKHMGI